MFIFDSVRVITCRVKSVYFYTSWIGGNEQRIAIKFCLEARVSATETLVLVQKAYGIENLSPSNVLDGILDVEMEGNW